MNGPCEMIGSALDKAVYLLQDCITSLGDSNQKMGHKLKKVLSYIRDYGCDSKKNE